MNPSHPEPIFFTIEQPEPKDPGNAGISVIIPVFNSEQTLQTLVERLAPVLAATGLPYETILVNDGSRDGSWALIEQITRNYAWVRGIDLMRNNGQENALLCGIRAATYDISVLMDDDLQNPPEEIPKLLAALADGCDVVYGISETESHGLLRNIASFSAKLMLRRMGAPNATEFKSFRTNLRNAFADYQDPYVAIDVLLTWGTNRFGSTRVRHEPRRVGKSNYTFAKLLTHTMNLVTGYSTLPLQLSTCAGALFLLAGLAGLLWAAATHLFYGTSPSTVAFSFTATCVFAGIQLLAIGIIGEYLARLHLRSMGRPPYTIRKEMHSQNAGEPRLRGIVASDELTSRVGATRNRPPTAQQSPLYVRTEAASG